MTRFKQVESVESTATFVLSNFNAWGNLSRCCVADKNYKIKYSNALNLCFYREAFLLWLGYQLEAYIGVRSSTKSKMINEIIIWIIQQVEATEALFTFREKLNWIFALFTSSRSCSCNHHLLIDGPAKDSRARQLVSSPALPRILTTLYPAVPMTFPLHLFHSCKR